MPDDNSRWVVWWYCGLFKDKRAGIQPEVLVAFRELLGDGSLGDDILCRRYPLTTLGELRIGSVWSQQICQAEIKYDVKHFHVDFSRKGWNVRSFFDSNVKKMAMPFPQEIYPLKYALDKNWLLEFKLPSGGKLVIPCLEFFYRCYGLSAELKRVLATYPWVSGIGGAIDRLYSDSDEGPDVPRDGGWPIKLRKRLVNGDAVFLAYVKHSKYSNKAAGSIYRQIEQLYTVSGKSPAFIKIAPWFTGPAEIKVKGIPFDDGKSFLALQVVGCSEPNGMLIVRDRDNTNKVNELADNKGHGHAWEDAAERKLIIPPESVIIQGIEPDSGSSSVEILEPDFEVLGKPCEIRDVRRDKAKDSAGEKNTEKQDDVFSGDERFGKDKGIGYSAAHAKAVMESQGILRDMWNAMLYLQSLHPELIHSVEWFTFEDGFSFNQEPKLIAITPFDESHDVLGGLSKTIINWPYTNTLEKRDLRGVLVARLKVSNKFVYIIEIQRRTKMKKDEDGVEKESEESFKGLVFTLNNEDNLKEWLHVFIEKVRHEKGVVQKLIHLCPGSGAAFKHVASKDDKVPCHSSLLNALHKVNVNVTD
ncbi:hypothetical protein [Pectobacterium brasiliense]|uniref:hypothetical protein n=1 Tax=Pectobacterium brasiliense TaxID=180957 RepID=UPI00068A9DFB|nr:hypothetical protein [Pectobacterium brasiliense]